MTVPQAAAGTVRVRRGGRAPRAIALAVALALSSTACGGEVAPVQTGLDATAVRFSELQDDLLTVNQSQAATVGLLRPALDALATVDAIVPLLLTGEEFDSGLQRVDAGKVALDLVDLEPVRPALLVVAESVDDARVSLRRARDVFDDPADLAYLDATDEVLSKLRDLTAAQDALAQVVERHLPVYASFLDLAADFRERRRRFRSADEAADAFSVEARRLVRDIGIAQADVREFLASRDAASREVAQAQERADAAFAERSVDNADDRSSDPSDERSDG